MWDDETQYYRDLYRQGYRDDAMIQDGTYVYRDDDWDYYEDNMDDWESDDYLY